MILLDTITSHNLSSPLVWFNQCQVSLRCCGILTLLKGYSSQSCFPVAPLYLFLFRVASIQCCNPGDSHIGEGGSFLFIYLPLTTQFYCVYETSAAAIDGPLYAAYTMSKMDVIYYPPPDAIFTGLRRLHSLGRSLWEMWDDNNSRNNNNEWCVSFRTHDMSVKGCIDPIPFVSACLLCFRVLVNY